TRAQSRDRRAREQLRDDGDRTVDGDARERAVHPSSGVARLLHGELSRGVELGLDVASDDGSAFPPAAEPPALPGACGARRPGGAQAGDACRLADVDAAVVAADARRTDELRQFDVETP